MSFKDILSSNELGKNAEVEIIEYDRECEILNISMKADKFIPEEKIQQFTEELRALPFVRDAKVKVNFYLFTRSEIEEDKKALLHALIEESKGISALVGSNMALSDYEFKDDKILFCLSQSSVFDAVKAENIEDKLDGLIDDLDAGFLFKNQASGAKGKRVEFHLKSGKHSREIKDALEVAEMKIQKELDQINAQAAQGALNGAQGGNKPRSFNGSGQGGNNGGAFKRPRKSNDPSVIYGNLVKPPFTKIIDVSEEAMNYSIQGEVFDIEFKELKSEKSILTFGIYDGSYSMPCKVFLNKDQTQEVKDRMKSSCIYRVSGVYGYDAFAKESCLSVKMISEGAGRQERKDDAQVKRVELHAHTTMSEVDGMVPAARLVEKAISWGHKAVAITDHGVLQAFPAAMEAAGDKIKVLYGVEGYMIDDMARIIENANDMDFDQEFVVFDVETTGFSSARDMITEIGAVKIRGREVVDTFQTFVNPQKTIPSKVVELTGITDVMVADAPLIDQALPEFLEFAGDSVLVAHNASFDMSFIRHHGKRLGYKIKNCVVDTLKIARLILKDIKNHKLDTITKHYNIEIGNHHRADDDAAATAKVLLNMLAEIEERGFTLLSQINSMVTEVDIKNMEQYHIVILVKNQEGIKDLYRLVSDSHIKYFHKRPRIPRSEILKYRDNLILGSACDGGEVYKGILNDLDVEVIEDIARFYDYLEIQPLGNPSYLVKQGKVESMKALENINKRIVELGEKIDRPVAATCDVHFMEPEDEIYRRIIMAGNGFGDADDQAPLYFRTTEEMLTEFEYLGREKAYEVVVENTNMIADMTESVLPVPNGTFPPEIEGAEEELRNLCFGKARRIYGENLPEIVEVRLEKEVTDIIKNGYAVMYIIARKLVVKSNEDGYLVGSRGSVGSSFAATMSDITEVNPLPPHYVCESCQYSEFDNTGTYGCGPDMPDKECPICGKKLKKDGYDIPFETFLGFNGDKEPDIDLNFAGEYQGIAHKYTEELFGEGYVFKAGTIGTIAEKTAFGYIKNYFQERGREVNSKELKRLQLGCTGVKRTSGQHPGGIMVVPSNKEIYDFTPIQYPANDPKSGVVTTHFDYHSISGRILKLDILGHDVPTIIRHLEEMTGIKGLEVPLDDKSTVSIFTSTKELNIVDSEYKCDTGSLGIPEFGTRFVRQMLVETQPSTLSELIRISGLSHGTDVWTNNAQNLVRDGVATLKQVISTRDDIMVYLIYQGVEKSQAFDIMEKVRKGRGLSEEQLANMKECGVPQWYIESCKIIKYMFPKAHAAAYVMMSFRIAWFKVNQPLAFYAAYFSTKVEAFDAQLICSGAGAIKNKIKELKSAESKTAKDEDLLIVLEVADEMYARGLSFHNVKLYESEAEKFNVVDGKVLPPLRSLSGIGGNAALAIREAAQEKEFLSIDDLKKRGKATKTAIEALREHGCLKGIPESDQLDIFSMLGI